MGEVIWNKTKKRNPWGIQQQRKRTEKDWIQTPMPQLRIISESEWKAAHNRLDATRSSYLRGTKGELWGRPASTLDSKYLLTGLVKCGLCGGSLYVRSSSRKGQRALFYGCTNFHLRGRTACTNSTLIPMEAANAAVLKVFEQERKRGSSSSITRKLLRWIPRSADWSLQYQREETSPLLLKP